MVDIGLYAITPYQFRISHDIGLENFLSPTEEQPVVDFPSETNHNGQNTNPTPSYESEPPQEKPDRTLHDTDYKEGKNGYKTKGVCNIDSAGGIFTLNLEKRPEKRERTRSGSEVISPEPKRLGPTENGGGGLTVKEIHYEREDDNGNISPATTSSDSSSVFQATPRACSDVEEAFDPQSAGYHVGAAGDISPVPGCSHHHSGGPVIRLRHKEPPRTPSPEAQHPQNERPVVVRRKRRPRKLPQIPPNAQRKSVATLLQEQGQSIADELTDTEPRQSRSQRAMKSMSWIEPGTRLSSENSSQDSGSCSHGYQSLDELGSPEGVDSSHMEMVEKSIIHKDLMENKQSLTRSITVDGTHCAGDVTVTAGSPVDDDVPTPDIRDSLMSASMSMSLMEELESEGIRVNNDRGSTFYEHPEYIDDEMPILKKFFGDDPSDSPRRANNNNNNIDNRYRNSSSRRGRTTSHNTFHTEESSSDERYGNKSSKTKSRTRTLSTTSSGRSRHPSSSSSYSGDLEALDATHRGCHKFIPRHSDELFIEIGDMISVQSECEDLWCEGVNLSTGKNGIFPAAYATDLNLLEDAEGTWKYKLRFLGSVEVSQHRGNDAICTAIQKVVMSRRMALDSEAPPLYCVQINEYGIKMMDTSKKQKTSHIRSSIRERLAKILNKEYKEEKDTDHFFTLKNITFCGFHPRNERYFAFISKHPHETKFACHVFLSERSTMRICEAVGAAFRRFYQEYMAFAHPTEDIYLE